ncbi:MAG: ATP-dependent DNA helicase RecG [Eubacteriales bacterium]
MPKPKNEPSSLTPLSPVTALPGISETRGALFAKLGIATLADLSRHYPRGYEMRGRVTVTADAKNGETVSLLLTIGTQPKVTTIRRGMILTRFTAFDACGTVTITYFNQPYLRDTFRVGAVYRFYGRCERAPGGRLLLSSPKYEPLPLSDPGDGSSLPAIYPVYKTTAKLTQKVIADAVAKALPVLFPPDREIPDPLPDDILHTYGLCGKRFACIRIHMPENESALDAARKRLIFEELMLFSLGLRRRRYLRAMQTAPPMTPPDMQPFYDAQPYTLTGAQMRAIGDFLSDMTQTAAACTVPEAHGAEKQHPDNRPKKNRGAPMNRLLSGDVGSGKTVCAAAALYIALENGYQAALMAPTEILATQHYEDLAPMFARLGYNCALLVGSTKAKEKTAIKAALASGELPLVIGTHALLEDNVKFRNCGLVITDEQHRFGVGQRAALAKKAEHVHTLIMSATPIPRTMALMLYGDLDMSILDELPPGRQKVSTFTVDESYRSRLNGFIRKQVTEGHQVYIVCPAIDEAEETGDDENGPTADDLSGMGGTDSRPTLKAAVAYAEELRTHVFPDLPVGFLHGRMKPAEKDDVMHRFAAGEIRILVSTTVIEVGVNVPAATLMVVENAEYFGLSQLHQLRGRVGRGRDKSWCILVSDAKSETARERLSIMCETNNGYRIAERDLELRGPGDFFVMHHTDEAVPDVRQSGGLRFAIASFCDDTKMVQDAFAAADAVMKEDPELKTEKYRALGEALAASFGTVIL